MAIHKLLTDPPIYAERRSHDKVGSHWWETTGWTCFASGLTNWATLTPSPLVSVPFHYRFPVSTLLYNTFNFYPCYSLYLCPRNRLRSNSYHRPKSKKNCDRRAWCCEYLSVSVTVYLKGEISLIILYNQSIIVNKIKLKRKDTYFKRKTKWQFVNCVIFFLDHIAERVP